MWKVSSSIWNLEPLDDRKQEILRLVCNEHIASAEPVGSEKLASQYSLGVRSATVRNEMAEMTEMGYLRQPHTSAGRIPSDRGYRFYVDRLMSADPLTPDQRRTVRQMRVILHQEVDTILREACRIISVLTRYTSMATPPIVAESTLNTIRLLVLDVRRILVVMVLGSGRVEHVVVDAPEGDAQKIDVEQLQIRLNATLSGRSCGQMAGAGTVSSSAQTAGLQDRIVASVVEHLRPSAPDPLLVEGEFNVMREPEFQDLAHLDSLLELLHSRKAIYNVMSRLAPERPVTIIIGAETGFDKARECSFVAARYSIGDTVAGAIGVLGPMRMRYSQALPVVRTVARQVTSMLTTLVEGVSGNNTTPPD
jgi:heat-inducible transcriptional repressor